MTKVYIATYIEMNNGIGPLELGYESKADAQAFCKRQIEEHFRPEYVAAAIFDLNSYGFAAFGLHSVEIKEYDIAEAKFSWQDWFFSHSIEFTIHNDMVTIHSDLFGDEATVSLSDLDRTTDEIDLLNILIYRYVNEAAKTSYDDGHQDGYDNGHDDGYREGYDEGKSDAEDEQEA